MNLQPDTRLRAAVIGCGRMGACTSDAMLRFAPAAWLPLSHAEAVLAQPDLELVGLCDISGQLLAAAQERFGGVRGFADYHELLDTLRPDVLTVATRTPERPGIISDALRAGVTGLHLEKPLCNSVAQLTELEALLAPPQLVCTFGTLRRYMPIYRRALDLATVNHFGNLHQVQVNMGRAPLLWTHPHSLDLLLFLAGDRSVKQVSARFVPDSVEIHGARLDGDPVVLSVLVEFADGVTGVVGQMGGCDAILACDEGTISVESDGRRIRLRSRVDDDPYWDSSVIENPGPEDGGTRLALDRLVAGLRGGEPSFISADKQAILTGQRLLLACGQSYLEGGRAVSPDALDPDLVITGRSGNRYA